ncbi:hypothetical protein [Bifidobacterium apri]|uniref:hypothetical protein n=1 Tax=Bifidobacterium apri TaxID=1769423 RepID=UPI001266886A|nr:hypothetical protein [Bifidobacterium apri]
MMNLPMAGFTDEEVTMMKYQGYEGHKGYEGREAPNGQSSADTMVTWERRIWERRLQANADWQRRQRGRRVRARLQPSAAGGYLPAV